MTVIVDNRKDSKKEFVSSKERFMRRHRRNIKDAIDKAISKQGITDIGTGGTKVTVPRRDTKEPQIHHGPGGVTRRVFPGNKSFQAGDRIPKPPGGGQGQGGSKPGNGGDSEDDFTFMLSEEEFLNYLFEDLELPNLQKKSAQDLEITRPRRAGYISESSPNRIDLAKSFMKKRERLLASNKPINREILDCLKEQFNIYAGHQPELAKEHGIEILDKMPVSKQIEAYENKIPALKKQLADALSEDDTAKIDALDQEIDDLRGRKTRIPKWNDNDLTYRNYAQEPVPATQAVMFCLMDVSGSMTQEKKDNAKLFYMLLYRFLKRNYKNVDVVFIRHTTEAEEVDEETFFYDRKSGGTMVSTSIQKMTDIMGERYPANEWNIYAAQASDGENWSHEDDAECVRLIHDFFKNAEAYFYTELRDKSRPHDQELWEAYKPLQSIYEGQFFMGKIFERKDIWPIFKAFFSRHEKYDDKPKNAAAYGPAHP